jgi:hypothetical protein
MHRILLASLFVFSSAICTEAATLARIGSGAMGPICNLSSMNGGQPFQRIDVQVKKYGRITWNGLSITKAQFEAYAADAAAHSDSVIAFIDPETESAALEAQARDLRSDAIMLGARVAQCSAIRGSNGHVLQAYTQDVRTPPRM